MLIAKAVELIIDQSPFLGEALREGLINVSALARKIKPQVEVLTKKGVQEGAVVMAIHRLPSDRAHRIGKGVQKAMAGLGDIIVRSGLSDHTFGNAPGLAACQQQLIARVSDKNDVFYTFSQGVHETTLVASSSLDNLIGDIFRKERLKSLKRELSSISLRLPESNTEISGIYYHILKQLAWAGINVCEVISTSNEITLVVSERDAQKAFPILMDLKKNT